MFQGRSLAATLRLQGNGLRNGVLFTSRQQGSGVTATRGQSFICRAELPRLAIRRSEAKPPFLYFFCDISTDFGNLKTYILI